MTALVDIVASLAAFQFVAFGILTGKARVAHGVKAPAVTGPREFECMYRVQMNTLELLVIFFPALYLAAKTGSAVVVAAIGAVYLVGRLVYWRSYVTDPAKRGLGFMLSFFPIVILLLMGLFGAVSSLFTAA